MAEKVTTTKNSEHITTGNVFEDLGFTPEEAAVLRLKTTLHAEIIKVVEKRKLSQKEVGKLLDMQQPQVSKLLNGDLERTTADRLTRYLRRLGREVTVRTKNAAKQAGIEAT